MNKGFIKTIIILLIITVIVFAVIGLLNMGNKTNEEFSPNTNYNQTTKTTTKETTTKRYDVGDDRNPLEEFNKNYTVLFVSSMVLLIIFLFFYFYLNRQKER